MTTPTGNDNDNGTQASTDASGDSGIAAKVRDTASESLSAARTRAADAYETARQRTSDAYSAARETASTAGRRTAEEIDANPIAALIGGLAIGAVAAALLPKTRREEDLFGSVGQRINDTARDAARAARDAGRDKLDELGLNAETARQRASELVGSTASAAAEAVRGSRAE